MAYNFDDETLKYYTQKLKEKLAEKDEIPTKTSDLSNDSGFLSSIPEEYVTETELDAKGYLTQHQDISGKANTSDLSTVATSGNYNDLINKPTIPSTTDVENSIKYKGVITTDINTCTTTGFYKVQQGTANLPINEYSFLLVYNEAGYGTLIQVWYSATSDKQRIRRRASTTWGEWYVVYTENEPPTIPSNLSEFTNDVGYLTEIPSEYVTDTELNAKGYLTSVPSEYITESELNSKGYLTEHQDISGKVDKINGKGLSTNDYTTAEKNKLNGIEENANNYSLPIASNTILGGIKIGSGLSIDSNGVLSSSGGSSDLSNYQTKTDNALTTTDKTIVGAINELDLDCVRLGDTIDDSVINVEENVLNRISTLETESVKAEDYEDSSVIINDNLTSRVSALETNKADKSSIPTSLPANGGNSNTVGGFSIWVGTQAEYDAITTKSSTTLYFIREV